MKFTLALFIALADLLLFLLLLLLLLLLWLAEMKGMVWKPQETY